MLSMRSAGLVVDSNDAPFEIELRLLAIIYVQQYFACDFPYTPVHESVLTMSFAVIEIPGLSYSIK
jgi:hypothetical protein